MHLNIDKDKLKIKLSGSFIADVADLFVDFFKKTIINVIVKAVDDTIPPVVASDINAMIVKT